MEETAGVRFNPTLAHFGLPKFLDEWDRMLKEVCR